MDYKKVVLDNGLRVILLPRPIEYSDTVGVLVVVGSGPDYEEKDTQGIHHFIEHLPFKGTKKRQDQGGVAAAVNNKGGSINAYTDNELVVFFVKMASEHLETALDIVSDMLTNPLFRKVDIKTEKGVIIEEMHDLDDNPEAHLSSDLWKRVLYGDQPAGRPTLGTEETIKGLTRDNILGYFKKHFIASNMVLAVSGGFDEKVGKELAIKYFSDIKTGIIPEKVSIRNLQTKPQLLICNGNTKQTHLKVGVKTANFYLSSPEKNHIELLSCALGGNMSSRIFISLRNKMGAAYSIKTESIVYRDYGWLAAEAGVDTNKIDDSIILILDEYKRIRDEIIPLQEFLDKKTFLIGDFKMRMDDVVDIAFFYAGQELMLDRFVSIEEAIKNFSSISREEVQKVAEIIFQPKYLNLTLIGPYKNILQSTKRFNKILNNCDW